jgi:hypothetical protein
LNLRPKVQRVLLGIALLLLVSLAWIGLSGGINQLPQSTTVGEKAQTLTQFAYGLFALLSAATAFRGRRWARLVRVGWVVSTTFSAGLASVIWGGTSLAIGLLSGAAAGLIASGIVWLLHEGVRGLRPTNRIV